MSCSSWGHVIVGVKVFRIMPSFGAFKYYLTSLFTYPCFYVYTVHTYIRYESQFFLSIKLSGRWFRCHTYVNTLQWIYSSPEITSSQFKARIATTSMTYTHSPYH